MPLTAVNPLDVYGRLRFYRPSRSPRRHRERLRPDVRPRTRRHHHV